MFRLRSYQIRSVEEYEAFLRERESAPATVEKYTRFVNRFITFLSNEGRVLDKASVLDFKATLIKEYAPATVNVGIAAINSYLMCCGAFELRAKRLRVQADEFRSATRNLTKGEYQKLVRAATKCSSERDALLVQAIGSTGVRVSEVQAITVEAAKEQVAVIANKGKVRRIWLPEELCRRITRFARKHRITSGPVFVSKTGKPLDRTRIWRVLKALAQRAGIDARKVFPHNLRHLFATVFYRKHNDIDSLSAVLGHTRVETTRLYLAADVARRKKQVSCLNLLT